ncbi:MAG: tripartite tricarboxylate transporter substrate binding protein [Alphaproteobacteria bacterium]|nr:tripartite tricarboxylate transporter substrate binding protein [Alphaproteobacteria bacterium]
MRRRDILALAAGAAAWPAAGRADGDYPSRPVRIIVPVSVGGATDGLAHLLAQRLSERMRASVVVENKSGAGSIIGTSFVAKSPADGYTLLMGGLFNMVMVTALLKDPPFDPPRDFTAVGYLAAYPFVAIVRHDLPVATLAEFAAYAKTRPGKLSYASGGLGTLQHVWGTILLRSLGLDLLHIPYKGATPALSDLIAGRVDFIFDNLAACRGAIDGGQVKALAVSSPVRTRPLPDLPTIDESGITRFEGESWFGLFAPAGTPQPVVDRLRREVAAVTAEPDFDRFVARDAGRLLVVAPDRQEQFLKDELARWTELITKYDVHAQ